VGQALLTQARHVVIAVRELFYQTTGKNLSWPALYARNAALTIIKKIGSAIIAAISYL